MTYEQISEKLIEEGYSIMHQCYCKTFTLENPIVGILVTCSPFLLNDVMHELWLWLPSEYKVSKQDEQTILIKK